MNADISQLSDLLIGEIVKDFGLPRSAMINQTFHPFFHRATDRLARLGVEFDRTVVEAGIPAAARGLLANFCQPVRTFGSMQVPPDGPLLVLSNHPGTYDSLVLFSQVNRRDARFISSSIPFVMAFPNASRHFIFATRDMHQRMGVVRQAIQHLQSGGAVLLFGSGHIDPDPGVYAPAAAAAQIGNWWHSAELLLKKVPETRLVLSIISHVVSPGWAHHPITWLRRQELDRRRLAELGQLVEQLLNPAVVRLSPRLSHSRPYGLEELRRQAGSEKVMSAVTQLATQLLEDHCTRSSPDSGLERLSMPGKNEMFTNI